jgi:hypothetical protein
VSNVIVHSGTMMAECAVCGAKATPELPMNIWKVVDFFNQFKAQHMHTGKAHHAN